MNKKLNFKKLALATGLAAVLVGSVQAESLLAPLVVSDSSLGFETLFSIKVRGDGTPNQRFASTSDLHYTYLRKGSSVADMFDLTKGCVHEDGSGTVSAWDVINHTIDPVNQILAQPPGDASVPYAPTTDFYGMAILDDVAAGGVEGDTSGFAYVMNYFTGMMLDYKMLNNHKSTQSGNFRAGFTRKTSVDFSWNPLARDATVWLGVATGNNMTSGNWNGTIHISQDTNTDLSNLAPTLPHDSSPAHTGAYDNDEVNHSGDKFLDITCMGLFTRTDFLTDSQEAKTRLGGWQRKSIIGSNGALGGLVYKAELKRLISAVTGTTIVSFQPETSGHLSSSSGSHANRPY